MENTYRNKEQDRRLGNIEGSIKTINSEMGDVKADIKGMKTDISWIKKMIFILIPIMAGVITSLIYLIMAL